MFNKRNIIIGLVILAIVGIIGNYFTTTENKPDPPVAKKAEKKAKKPPPTHSDIEGIDPYTVADIHAIVGDSENTIERILYRARWNFESDPTNQKFIDRNKKMRQRYEHSIDEKLLRAITLVALFDQSVGYNAYSGGYRR